MCDPSKFAPHPLKGSWNWFRETYPRVLANARRQKGRGQLAPGHQAPLECVQGPGQVVYLPSGWKHLTLNIGEAIGVGGQAGLDPRDRYAGRCGGLTAVALALTLTTTLNLATTSPSPQPSPLPRPSTKPSPKTLTAPP